MKCVCFMSEFAVLKDPFFRFFTPPIPLISVGPIALLQKSFGAPSSALERSLGSAGLELACCLYVSELKVCLKACLHFLQIVDMSHFFASPLMLMFD